MQVTLLRYASAQSTSGTDDTTLASGLCKRLSARSCDNVAMPQRDSSRPLAATLLRDAEAELRRQVQPWVADAGCEISSLRISDMSEAASVDPLTLEPEIRRPNEELLIEMDLRDDSGAIFHLSYPVGVWRMAKDFQSEIYDISESMMCEHSEMASDLVGVRDRIRVREGKTENHDPGRW